jgi:hypothetical protein
VVRRSVEHREVVVELVDLMMERLPGGSDHVNAVSRMALTNQDACI